MEPLYLRTPHHETSVAGKITACCFGECPDHSYTPEGQEDLFFVVDTDGRKVVLGFQSVKVLPVVRRWGPKNPRQLEGREVKVLMDEMEPVGLVPVPTHSMNRAQLLQQREKNESDPEKSAESERRARPRQSGTTDLLLDVYGTRHDTWPVIVLEEATKKLIELYQDSFPASRIRQSLSNLVRNELELAFAKPGQPIPGTEGRIFTSTTLKFYITQGRIWRIEELEH